MTPANGPSVPTQSVTEMPDTGPPDPGSVSPPGPLVPLHVRELLAMIETYALTGEHRHLPAIAVAARKALDLSREADGG